MKKTFNKTDIDAITRVMNVVNNLANSGNMNSLTVDVELENSTVEFTREELNRAYITLVDLWATAVSGKRVS